MQSATITVWRPGEARPSTRRIALEEIADEVSSAEADDDGLVWVDLVAPSMRELLEVGERIGLHPLEVEDAVAPRERPKASHRSGHAAFVSYAVTPREDVAAVIARDRAEESDPFGQPERSEEADHAIDRVLEGGGPGAAFGDPLFAHTRVSGFVLSRALVTVRSDDAADLGSVHERCEEMGDVRGLGPYAVAHALLDVVVDGFDDAVQFLDDRIEDLEDDLFTGGRMEGFQRRAYALRKELMCLQRAVLPLRDVIGALWRRPPGEGAPRPDEDPRPQRLDAMYADLVDHALRVTEWTESLRDMVTTVFDTHLSLQDQHLNQVMKKLAGWAAVISVPTLVTGWFGMNVPYPGDGAVSGLVAATILVLVPAALLWVGMRRSGWL